MANGDDSALGELLEHVKRARGFDFSGYKPASLRRRIESRMRTVEVASYGAYLEYLELHPQEFDFLFNAILINVTSFFRDPSAWAYLQEEVLPEQLAMLDPTAPIRVWCAGCASGEEAYTLAMVLAEHLGHEQFRRRVKIYGTDIDDQALQQARTAVYSERQVSSLPVQHRDRYFELVDGHFGFRPDLRRSVIFGRLDVLRDAPISRLEILTCRNTLMYLNAETQAAVVERFRFGLNDHGILVLGKAETLLSNNSAFVPIDRKRRIFRKVARPAGVLHAERPVSSGAVSGVDRVLERAALDASPVPTLVIDPEGSLMTANQRARAKFGLPSADGVQPLRDLEISFRPTELRDPIEQALARREEVVIRSVPWDAHGTSAMFDVTITPLLENGRPLGAIVAYHDVTQQRALEDQLRYSNEELAHAYEEVQSTNEELETTNEELQSTVEELETTNEELQSTNEELETMNEELQSANDELHAVNDELRIRGDEVDQLNHFLAAILASQRGGVTVVDTERRVRIWTAQAEELWGLREDEVRGRDLLDLDIGLPVRRITRALNACLRRGTTPSDLSLEAVTRRGRAVTCEIALTPLRERDAVSGAIVLMHVAGES